MTFDSSHPITAGEAYTAGGFIFNSAQSWNLAGVDLSILANNNGTITTSGDVVGNNGTSSTNQWNAGTVNFTNDTSGASNNGIVSTAPTGTGSGAVTFNNSSNISGTGIIVNNAASWHRL